MKTRPWDSSLNMEVGMGGENECCWMMMMMMSEEMIVEI